MEQKKRHKNCKYNDPVRASVLTEKSLIEELDEAIKGTNLNRNVAICHGIRLFLEERNKVTA